MGPDGRRIVAALAATKFGDRVVDVKTVLPWLLGALGAPTLLVGLLVPVRESGSLLPQIFIGGFVRRRPLRKPVWITGSLLQCAAAAGIGVVAATLDGAVAGWLMLGCLAVFALARGLNSVSSKDLKGKTIPKGRRGRLGGIAASVSGTLAVGIGLFMSLKGRQLDSPWFYGGLLVAAGGMWLLAVLVFSWLKEYPGETEGGGNAWREALANLRLLRQDREFRRFVVTRSLLLASALAAPFYVVLAREHDGASARTLGTFIVAGGLAASLSAPFWGIMADRSSRRVMITAAVQTALLGIAVFLVVRFAPHLADSSWALPGQRSVGCCPQHSAPPCGSCWRWGSPCLRISPRTSCCTAAAGSARTRSSASCLTRSTR